MIAFYVPGEPVAKGRPRFVCATGRTFTPAKTISYEGQVKSAAYVAMDCARPMEGPVRLTVRATWLVPKSWSKKRKDAAVWKESKPDADNIAKIVKDALNGLVYRDDAQVAELIVQKRYGVLAGLTVSIEQLQNHGVA
jgi:Holliday junction resolvase RusA-like endonuclease